jgi:hypothetical protein
MSQPYGQQPPGNQNQGPGYGAMPPAPPEYSSGPIGRPGATTAAAVLAFVQAGITAIPGVMSVAGASSVGGGNAEGWLSTIAILAGVALLIVGGVQLMGGKDRNLLVIACALEVAISLYFIIRVASVDSEGIEAVDYGKGVIIGFAVFFAIMPAISFILARGAATTQYLQSRRAPR